jgi:tRNA-binding protein
MGVKPEAPQKQKITFGKFENVDMRVARILSARPAEGTAVPSRYLELDLGHLGPRASVTAWPTLVWCGRSRTCSARSRPTRRCRG